MEVITFGADSVRISGPGIDKSMTITFKTGEYQAQQIAELMKLSVNDVMFNVSVEVEG